MVNDVLGNVSMSVHMRAQLDAKASQELANLQAQHDAAKAPWELMLAHQSSDSKLFKFTVRGAEGSSSASVPWQIFEAEPTSALSKIYNGEWEYTTDDQGRAVVNSNPIRWQIILGWLSFGTVPSNPTPELISECKFWQLERLLTNVGAEHSIQASPADDCDSHLFSIVDSQNGFVAYGSISNWHQRLASVSKTKVVDHLGFAAFDREWSLDPQLHGMYLHMLKGKALEWRQNIFCVRCGRQAAAEKL